ncbi:MAG: SCO family protein [Verrucomicrobia bacterium]|nr:SCO family protein [Verrucomicrobiota bacterium]
MDREAGSMVFQPDMAADSIVVTVGRGDRLVLREGQAVRGELVPFGGGQLLQTIFPNDTEQAKEMAQINAGLFTSSRERRGRVFRTVGESVPPFALYNQQGQVFTQENLLGKYTVLNFIFTRCAVPTMCPLSTRKMKETQDLAAALGWENVQFVSMTLDPAFDTPGVFKAYALDYDLKEDNFHLLAGPVAVLRICAIKWAYWRRKTKYKLSGIRWPPV